MSNSPVGKTLGISTEGIAHALKNMVWGVPIEGVMYDGEFTGEISDSGKILIKIKKKSTKQPTN